MKEPIECVEDGYVELPKKPGLGVEVGYKVIHCLGYKTSGLPEMYRSDGSVGEH